MSTHEEIEGKWLMQKFPVATEHVRYPAPTLSPTTKSANIEKELIKMCEAFGDVGDDWTMVESPIGFPDDKTKKWWDTPNDIWDTKKIFTIAALEREKWQGAKYKIALLTTRQSSWVRKSSRVWSKEDWHCWVAILRKMPKEMRGCELIIWDCNFDEDNKFGMVPRATGAQHVLINKLRRSTAIQRVWIGGGGNTQEGQCLQLSINFIHAIIRGRKVGNLLLYKQIEEYR